MSRRAAAAPTGEPPRQLDRFGLLLVLTVAVIVLRSLVGDVAGPRGGVAVSGVVLSAFVGLMYVLALRAVGVSRRWRRIGDLVVAVGLAATCIMAVISWTTGADVQALFAAGRPSPASLGWMVPSVALPALIVRRLLQRRQVSLQTLLGAVTAYLQLAVAFDYLFRVVDAYQAAPFFGQPEPSTAYMYFSLVCITTLGFGDLAPVTPVGRLLAVSEAVIGQVFLVTFVAMVVGLLTQRVGETGGRRARRAEGADGA